MIILIDKITNKVVGVNSPATPLTISITVPDDFDLTKEIQEVDLEKPLIQKTDSEGNLLYKKPKFKTITIQRVVGQEETTEVTDKPVMETVQKTDIAGNPLYYEPIYEERLVRYEETTEVTDKPSYDYIVVGTDENGEPIYEQVQRVNENGEPLYLKPIYEKYIIDYVESTKKFDEDGTPLQPVLVQKQKLSVNGNPLYWKDIIEVEEQVIEDGYEEVPYEREVLEWETKEETITYTVPKEEIDPETGETITVYEEVQETKTVQVPKKYGEPYEPVMIDNLVTKTVTLKERPKEFTLEEVLIEKYKGLLEKELLADYILADCFLNEQDLDLTDPNHSANTGLALVQLLPYGQCKTKSITLEVPAKEFYLIEFDADEGVEIYLAGKKFTDNKVILTDNISTCTIKFVNTTDKPKMIRSYAIGY
ncbi:MAG: hypothetical protein H0Z24_05980 [Thermosipho sp. (in: Bacteria)]|nr:hypothetical protein [Thermosipho sp. (in: thermotogales)]